MALSVALRDCLFQSFCWKGCLSRKRYWQSTSAMAACLTIFVGFSSLGWPSQATVISPPLGLVFGFLFLSATVRRLHDSGHSGWWCLIAPLTLIGAVPLLFFLVQKSRFVDNPYRRNTRQVSPTRRAVALVVRKKPVTQKSFLCA